MSDDSRIKRPALDRTEPIRNWSTLLGGAGAGGDLGDVVARSVDLGYRVVDEYIRQGQKAAERLNGRAPLAPDSMASDLQDAAARMTQYASDFVRVWFEFMGAAMASNVGLATASPAPPQNGAAAQPVAAAPERTRVHIEVASRRPVEVALDLRPGAAHALLVAHALRSVDPDSPPLTEATFVDGDDGSVRLRVRVPDEHPPGIYNGLVLDQHSNRPVGTLSVRVAAE
jgi:hypothetical protein